MVKWIVTVCIVWAAVARANTPNIDASEAKCTKKRDGAACLVAAGAYNQGSGGRTKDLAKAAELWERACDARKAEGCNLAGAAYEMAHGVKKDLEKAQRLYQKACDKKHANGCDSLASVIAARTDSNNPKVAATYERACKLGNGDSCFWLATWVGGEGPKTDLKKSIRYYEKGCKAKSVLACTNLGVLMSKGEKGAPNNPKRANELLRFGCDANDKIACSMLSNNYFAGRGVAKNVEKSKEIRRKACKLGHRASCDMLDASGVGR